MPDRRSPHRARRASPPGQVTEARQRRPAGVDEATKMHRLGTQHCVAMGSPPIPERSVRSAPDTASGTEPLVIGGAMRGALTFAVRDMNGVEMTAMQLDGSCAEDANRKESPSQTST